MRDSVAAFAIAFGMCLGVGTVATGWSADGDAQTSQDAHARDASAPSLAGANDTRDGGLAAILAQKIDVVYRRVRLSELLQDLHDRTALRAAFPQPIDTASMFSLEARQITVGQVVEQLADGLGLEVEQRDDQLVFWKRADEKILSDLEDRFRSGDVQARCEAIHDLARLGDRRIHATLRRALGDDAIVAAHAIIALEGHRGTMYLAGDASTWVEPLVTLLAAPAMAMHRSDLIRLLGPSRDPRTIAPLVTLTGDADPRLRCQAAFALAATRDPRATAALIALLKANSRGGPATPDASGNAAPDAMVRDCAAYALGETHDANAISSAVDALAALAGGEAGYESDGKAQIAVALALGGLRDPRVAVTLLALLRNPDVGVSISAACALGELRDPATIPMLVDCLRHWHPDVRSACSLSLARFGAPALEPLVAAMASTDANIRLATASALMRWHDPRAIDALIALLQDPDATMRIRAAKVLGQSQDARALGPLIALARKGATGEGLAAVAALGQMREPGAIDALLVLARDPQATVRADAAAALADARDPRASEALVAMHQDPDAGVRLAVASALRDLPETRSIEPLLALLKDRQARVRSRAIISLGGERGARVCEWLVPMLLDADAEVGADARFVLARLQDPRAIATFIACLDHANAGLTQAAEPARRRLIDRRLAGR